MDPADLAFAGAAEQARLVASGAVTARELVTTTLERIARLDPELRAFRVVLGDDALAAADDVDARRDRGEPLGALAGVPVAIKDDADLAGEVTAMGSAAHGPAATADSEVVARLRAAGAIPVGKTHVPELMTSPWTESLAFGATRNPWDVTRTPGGSSGGTGAAVAAGLVGVGLGSDGGGSIRIPSAFCGLFGLKPTRDRVPLAPTVDAWQGMSVFGPLARRVEDAALFLDVTSSTPVPDDGGFAALARTADPGRLRMATSRKIPPGVIARLGRAQRDAWSRTVDLVRELGHDVARHDPDVTQTLLPQTITRITRGIADDAAHHMPHPSRMERRTRQLAAIGRALPDGAVARARRGEAAQDARLRPLFEAHDVLLTPMLFAGPARIGAMHGASLAKWLMVCPGRVAYAPLWNLVGYPACSVPAGFDADGLPLAVQIVAPPGREDLLVSVAAQIERARPWADRRPALAA